MPILCSTGAFTRTSDPGSHEVILRYAQEIVALKRRASMAR